MASEKETECVRRNGRNSIFEVMISAVEATYVAAKLGVVY